jgi:predicted Zn-dependent protease
MSMPLAAQMSSSMEAAFTRAVDAMQAGEYAQAEEGFKTVLAADPKNFSALGNLGAIYARTHRLAAAIEVDERALKIDPDDPGILLNLGLAFLKQEDYTRASVYLKRLEATGKAGSQATILLATSLILGDAPKDGLDLLKMRKLDTADPSALYLQAVAYARLNQMLASEEIFEQLLNNGSTRAQASFLLAQALHDGHHLREAADSFQEVIHLSPAYPGAHRELGKVYVSMNSFEDAERELRIAVAQDSQDGGALYYLGALLVQLEHSTEGVPYLIRAQTLLPDSWAVPFYLGKAKLHEHHADEAIPLFRQAASMNADEPQIFYLLAQALRASGQSAEAKIAMNRVEALHSTALDAERDLTQKKIPSAH